MEAHVLLLLFVVRILGVSDVPSSFSSFSSLCNCTLGSSVKMRLPNTKCYLPSKFRIKSISSSPVPAFSEILSDSDKDSPYENQNEVDARRLLGSVGEMRMADVRRTSFACVEGRDYPLPSNVKQRSSSSSSTSELTIEDVHLRAFGGDFGEFAIALAEVAAHVGSLDQTQVDTFFLKWIDVPLDYHSRELFSYHTDIEAVLRLQQFLNFSDSLSSDSSSSSSFSPTPLLDLVNPSVEIQEPLLEAVLLPQHQGCVHIRSLLLHPDQYQVPTYITSALLKSFFKVLWRKDQTGVSSTEPLYLRLKVVVSPQHHHVHPPLTSLLAILNSRGCHEAQVGSVLANQGSYMFHPKAVNNLRRELSRFFYSHSTSISSYISNRNLTTTLMARGQIGDRRTLSLLLEGGGPEGSSVPLYLVEIL